MVRLVKMAQFFNGPKIKTDCDIELKFDIWTMRDIKTVFQKLSNSEGVGLQIEKILDDFTWNDPTLNQIRLPRCYFNSSSQNVSTQLHAFSDASKMAYSYVFFLFLRIHIREQSTNQEKQVDLRYWILHRREAVKRIVRQCAVCKKFECLPFKQGPFQDLPQLRVDNSPPFTDTGLYFAGPLYVHESSGNSSKTTKVYVLLFTCVSTRAVHLEIVERLDVETFLRAFRRFAARRVLP